MPTGIRISKCRQYIGLTQTQLAAKVGVNTKSVKDWESGVSMPSAKKIVELSRVFGVTSDYLLGLDNRSIVCLDNLSFEDQIRAKAFIQLLLTLRIPTNPK